MNILNFLNKSGKVALSALQAVGLTAVVGAAGIGAWQYLSGPADDNTSFNPAQYNPGEVVYVSGANTGSYGSNTYGAGDPGSSVQVSSKTLQRLDRRAMAERAAQEMEEESSQIYSSADSGTPAYQMGGTEGLGMGANYVADANSNSSPMGVMQQSMAGMQDMIAKAQQQVAGAATDKGGKEGAATLGSVTPNWSRGAGGISAGGSGGANSSFALQDSGKNKGRGGKNADPAADTQAAIAAAQAQAAGMLEGARIRGKSSFGSMETLGANRDASIDKAGRGRNGKNDLEFIQKRSADAAANRHRAANEGSRAFLASTQVSGGMRITAENVTTGQGQGSKDFDQNLDTHLRGIRTWEAAVLGEEIQRGADRNSLVGWLAGTIVVAVAAMILISWLMTLVKNGGPYAWIPMLGVLAAIAGVFVMFSFAWSKAADFADKWGSSGLSISVQAVAIGMVVGAFAAMIFYSAIHEFWLLVAKWLGTSMGGALAGSAVGSAGTALGGQFTDSAVDTGSTSGLPPDNMA